MNIAVIRHFAFHNTIGIGSFLAVTDRIESNRTAVVLLALDRSKFLRIPIIGLQIEPELLHGTGRLPVDGLFCRNCFLKRLI